MTEPRDHGGPLTIRFQEYLLESLNGTTIFMLLDHVISGRVISTLRRRWRPTWVRHRWKRKRSIQQSSPKNWNVLCPQRNAAAFSRMVLLTYNRLASMVNVPTGERSMRAARCSGSGLSKIWASDNINRTLSEAHDWSNTIGTGVSLTKHRQ